MPLKFDENAKLQHCLDIFYAVATDGQCEILGKSGLGKTELQNVSNDIANDCMDQLYTWEGNVTRDRKKKGYSGLVK